MLAPRASSAFVCARCELRLARQRVPPFITRFPPASFSTSARRTGGLEELEAIYAPKRKPAPRETAGAEDESSFRTTRHLRRRRGDRVQATSASLGGLKRLGEDAKVLVLRELDDGIPQPRTRDESESAQPIEPVEIPDIQAELQEQKRNLTAEEINGRLESLRPTMYNDADGPHYIKGAAFLRLGKALDQGFTRDQLLYYCSTAQGSKKGDYVKDKALESKRETSAAKGVVTRSSWQPGNTSMNRRLPILQEARSSRKGTTKQVLVTRILREVWRLVPQEDEEASGEIELHLKPWQLSLLEAGDKETMLSKVAAQRIAKLEIFAAHSVLRITADKTTAEYAADDIEKALADTYTKKLQLKDWIPVLVQDSVPEDKRLAKLFTQEHFDMITSLTRATIQRMDNANMLVIRGITQGAVNEAERLVISLLPHKSSVATTVDLTNVQGDRPASLSLAIIDETSLEYQHRKVEFGRWTLPVKPSQSLKQPDSIDPEPPAKETRASDRFIDRVFKDMRRSLPAVPKEVESKSPTAEWQGPDYTLSATFGHALFPISSPKSTTTVFIPKTPGLTSLLTNPALYITSHTPQPSLVYNFIPAASQPTLTPDQVPPTLRIQVRTSPSGGKPELNRVRLYFNKAEHTVLLPGQVTDIQFSTSGKWTLGKSKRGENKAVEEWFAAVSDNITSGEKLHAPDLTLSVPSSSITRGKTRASTTAVTYLFSDMLFRQAVNGSFDGAIVGYEATQAGKLGASAGSLGMYYSASIAGAQHALSEAEGEGENEAGHEYLVKNWVSKCLALNDTINQATAQSVPVGKMLKPRVDSGERKTRRKDMASQSESGQGS